MRVHVRVSKHVCAAAAYHIYVLCVLVLCSSYLASHEGGFRQEGTMVEYFKSVVDLVNSFYAVDRCVRCVWCGAVTRRPVMSVKRVVFVVGRYYLHWICTWRRGLTISVLRTA